MTKVIVYMLVCISCMIPLQTFMTGSSRSTVGQDSIGYLPSHQALALMSLDHKQLTSQWLFFKVITYFGGRVDPYNPDSKKNIDYYDMYRLLDAATHLDPRNIDIYYFVQAIYTWDIGRVLEANVLLERGAQSRTWDHMLPFFLGFNNYYFIKDYSRASLFFQLAADRSKDPFLASLAARSLHEADNTTLAIAFLRDFIKTTDSEIVRATLERRMVALERIEQLEKALQSFQKRYGRFPSLISELQTSGIVDRIPEDPYGGHFYLDNRGHIRTTSKLAQRSKDANRN